MKHRMGKTGKIGIILILVLILVLIFALVFALFFGYLAAKTKDELAVLPEIKTSGKKISVIDRGNLSEGEYIAAASLQGIVAQTEAEIYIKDGGNMIYLQEGFPNFENAEVKEYSDFWSLLGDYKSYLAEGGCVLFEEKTASVNTAATVAGVESWLAVPVSQKDKAEAAGLNIKMDLTQKKDGEFEFNYEYIFKKYKDKLNPNLVIHQSPDLVTLRDYAVAARAFCFYTDENSKADKKFRDKVFSWAENNAPVLGWSADELGYVQQASENGLYVIPSDHCSNLSFLSGMDSGEPIKQTAELNKIQADKSKHYIAFIVSDGDNVQWYETTLLFREHFRDRIDTNENYKLTWTAPPALTVLAPQVLRSVYGAAGANNRFICGVSGMGYINPTEYPKRNLKVFADESVKIAKTADLSVFATLDNTVDVKKLQKAMNVYAENDDIPGGFMQIGNKYEELGGKIIFANGKPFVSAGKSFWYIGENPQEKATKEYIEQFAKEINELPADINSENGYTYVNVHPWSTTMSDLNYLVSLLDEHIEIVFAEEMLEMIKENVE